MRLTISNLPSLDQPDHFHALFGRYVYGYKPWTHCQDGLLYREATAITPKLQETPNPEPIDLHDDLFYLCAVGRKLTLNSQVGPPPRQTNVHLAVRPRKGSIAAIGSVYGATFVIEDAEQIRIEAPTRRFPMLESDDPKQQAVLDEHKNCRMFHFAYQMFEAGELSPDKTAPVIRQLRKPYKDLSGIRQDASGCMLDPQPFW